MKDDLTFANFVGCIACPLLGHCEEANQVKLSFQAKKPVFWDHMGRRITPFQPGDVFEADARVKDGMVMCVCAYSPQHHSGDFVELNTLEIA